MFTFDDLLDEMRRDGTLTPAQEAGAEEIKAKARVLADKYLERIDEALNPLGNH